MGRSYGVPVSVCELDGRPVRFTWEGRLFVVRRVLDHWVSPGADREPAVRCRPRERANWRVRVSSRAAPGVYELQHDIDDGQWRLARVWE